MGTACNVGATSNPPPESVFALPSASLLRPWRGGSRLPSMDSRCAEGSDLSPTGLAESLPLSEMGLCLKSTPLLPTVGSELTCGLLPAFRLVPSFHHLQHSLGWSRAQNLLG